MPTTPKPPTVTVKLADGSERTVVFDIDTLARIEEATSLSIFGIIDELRSYTPRDGKPGNFRISFVRKFIAGCLGVDGALSASIPMVCVAGTLRDLVDGFVAAVGQLEGAEGKAATPTGSASPPGPGSSSGSDATNSDGSGSGSSQPSENPGGGESSDSTTAPA